MREHRPCPWEGCRNEPELHPAELPNAGTVYWVVCDTTTTANNNMNPGGHMVVGPEAKSAEEAWRRWDERMTTALGRPKKS